MADQTRLDASLEGEQARLWLIDEAYLEALIDLGLSDVQIDRYFQMWSDAMSRLSDAPPSQA